MTEREKAEASIAEQIKAAKGGFDKPTKDQLACDHAGYSFEKMGRCCFKCGVFMVDWGD